MGKSYFEFIRNRCLKIARHKKRRIGKKHNNNYNMFKKSVPLRKSQKTFKDKNFYFPVESDNTEIAIIIPESFDLINNADESLKVLKQINFVFEKSNYSKLILNYGNCKKLGLEASVLTDLIVLNGLKYRKFLGKQISLFGNQPTSYNAGEIFWNSGLLKHLNLSKIEDPMVDRLDPFKITMDDALATSETLKYINKCLKLTGYELNNNGTIFFTRLIGEIIGNEKNHSGENGEWYVSGHFTQATPGEYGIGRLSFISIGNTIYENLINNCKNINTKNKIENHLKKQQSLFNIGYNKESSVTVFGLQYKISSETDENQVDRGTGTIKFIDSFAKLGQTVNNEKPKMAIISGNTHILYDGTYNLKEKSNGKDKVQVIAFNKENDINKKPDPNYVKVLKNGFPGVIISLEFYLDKKYLEKFKEVK